MRIGHEKGPHKRQKKSARISQRSRTEKLRVKAAPIHSEYPDDAMCIAIRDHSSHDKLRKLISHLPKIMNRANPYTAEQEQFLALEQRNVELSDALVEAAKKFKKLEADRSAPSGAKRSADTSESTLPPQET